MVSEEIIGSESASLGVWVRAGAIHENKKNAGISHFVEHMMFKGTKKRTAKALAEDVDRIGAQINAFTGKEATCYYIKTLASNLRPSMEILLDMFNDALFDSEEMEREKLVVYEEMKMVEDMPDEYAHELISEIVFRERPLGQNILGTKESVADLSRDDILDYIQQQYTGNNIVFSIAGNFDWSWIVDFLEERLKGRRRGKLSLVYERAKKEPAYLVKVRDIEQSHICLGIPSLPMNHPDYYAFSIINSIMGGTMSSRIFQNIREQKGLAYSVYSVNSSFARDGYYIIYAGVSHGKISEAIGAIGEELSLLDSDGVSEEELNRAKEQQKSSYIFGQESVNGRMFSNGKNTTLLGKAKTAQEVLKAIDQVSREDIHRVAEEFVRMDRYSGVIVTNREIPLKELIQGRK